MATTYLNVDVSSQRGHSQVKVNGATGYENILHVIRNAPIRDLIQVRIELLKLLRTIDDALIEAHKPIRDL